MQEVRLPHYYCPHHYCPHHDGCCYKHLSAPALYLAQQSINEDAAPALTINTYASLLVCAPAGWTSLQQHRNTPPSLCPMMLSLPSPGATSCLWICLVLRGPVWVVWSYTGLCGQSQGLKNRLRAEADIDNQGRDGARTGREHAGKKAQCFLRTGMWIKLTLHLRSASYCSSPFICLTTSFCHLLLYNSLHTL